MAKQLKNWPFWLFGLVLLASTLGAWMGAPESYLFPNHRPPFFTDDEGHFFLLGTTTDGRDLARAILFGSGYSIWLGLLTTAVIGAIGLFLGGIMGYYHKRKGVVGPFSVSFMLMGAAIGYFYGFGIRKYLILDASSEGILAGLLQILLGMAIFLVAILLFYRLGKWIDEKYGLGWSISFGEGMTWLLQVLDSLPTLLLILTLMAIFQEKSLVLVMVLIALSSWSQMALLVRGQVMKELELPYIQAAKMLGMKDFQVFWRHLLPNILPAVAVVLALTVGRIILAEASLGFLGLIQDYEGLGGLISRSRSYPDYPWLGIFPGLMLASIMLLIHLMGDRFKLFE